MRDVTTKVNFSMFLKANIFAGARFPDKNEHLVGFKGQIATSNCLHFKKFPRYRESLTSTRFSER